MTYASVSTGYKGGGVNPRPSSPAQLSAFTPEDLTAYEIGEKSQFFDNRLRFNSDIFVEDYKDLQTPGVPPGSAGSIYLNTGHVLIYGTEIEATATPLPGLQLDAAAGWLHTKTLAQGAAVLNQANPPLPGERVPGIPNWKISAGAPVLDRPAGLGRDIHATVRLALSEHGVLRQPAPLRADVGQRAADPRADPRRAAGLFDGRCAARL